MLKRLIKILSSIWILVTLTSCEDEFRPDDGLDYANIAQHYVFPVYKQTQYIREISATGKADFVFITDTHLADNSTYSPYILRFLVHNGFADRVIWGGDAISAYGDIETEWREHQRLFLSAVRHGGHYYMVRGNHEFTSKVESTGQGVTYDDRQTTNLLLEHTEADVVRSSDDPMANYYYVDDASAKLRYCIFDTTDSVSSTTEAWATFVHTRQQQLEWMDKHALHNVPQGYSLIIFTHIGVIQETFHGQEPLEPIHQLIQQAEAPVLMVISGHMHQDFQTYDNGVLHILTGSDATYPEYNDSPFLHDILRSRYHVSAQLLDCFCISTDRRLIDAVRIGAGYNRSFHIEPMIISLSDTRHQCATPARIDPDKIIRWTCYDATGYQCIKGRWDPPSTIAQVSSTGRIQPLREGNAVVMATARDGSKEFFPIQIVP